jgi:hypothetical protein
VSSILDTFKERLLLCILCGFLVSVVAVNGEGESCIDVLGIGMVVVVVVVGRSPWQTDGDMLNNSR